MKYLKTYENLNVPKEYILCLLDHKDRWDRNFYHEGKEPVYVIFKVLKHEKNNSNYYDTDLKIIYEYQDEDNYCDRRWDKIRNEERLFFESIKDKIIYQSNNSKDVLNKLNIIRQSNKFNL